MRMLAMKFEDIPAQRWFQDGSGRRMIKMQRTNGAVIFHYLSYATPKDLGCERISLAANRASITNTYFHENTQECSFSRELNKNDIRFSGFNAVDDKGQICRCPLDVEFYVEEVKDVR